jgi:purine catabolism regulator
LVSVAQVLDLAPVRAGQPKVRAGFQRLGQTVRWAHVAEIAEIGGLLQGHELVLSTGLGWPRDEVGLVAYIRQLAQVPVAGVMIELGRSFDRLPECVIAAAAEAQLPLIELSEQVAFVEITEAVHRLVLETQVSQLEATGQIHEAFTELALSGAEPQRVLHLVAGFSQRPVILENLSHQVLECDPAGRPPEEALTGWASRSRASRVSGRTGWDSATGLLITQVGARGRDWGRLALIQPERPSELTVMVLERAAATLALNQLLDSQRHGWEQLTGRNLLTALLEHSMGPNDVLLRARAAGVVLDQHRLLGLLVRLPPRPELPGPIAQGQLHELGEALRVAARDCGLPALAGPSDESSVLALLGLASQDRETEALGRLAERLRTLVRGRLPRLDQDRLVVAAGTVVAGIRDAARTLREAQQVAQAATRMRTSAPYLQLPDLRVRGLLHLMADDPRLRTFAERELGALLEHDHRTGEDLVGVLRGFLAAGGNKSAAASGGHLSRPAFYDRLGKVARVLGADLGDPETRLSLHLALLAHELG